MHPERPKRLLRPLQPLLVGAAVVAVVAGACRDASRPEPATLAAASSLRSVLPALITAYMATPGAQPVRATYGASGSLRRQVEGGAPIAAVLFASGAPVDALIAKGLAQPGSRRVVATNRLVLIGPASDAADARLTFRTLGDLPADAKVAVGDPGAVPAGDYARQALRRLGIWDGLRGRLVFGGDVAMVLAYARRAEVSAAIVYETDLHGVDDVVVYDRAGGDWAPTPQVVAALTGDGAERRAAAAFLDFVASPAGRALLVEHGFTPL